MTQSKSIQTIKPTIDAVSDEQIQALHDATLQIFTQTGVEMQDPQGREILLDAGAEEAEGRIRIPENLVTDAIDRAPSSFPMCDRLGEVRMRLEQGRVYFGSGSDTTFTHDIETGERRRSVSQDVENLARVADSLDNIDFVMSMANPSDVPPDDLYIHAFIKMPSPGE